MITRLIPVFIFLALVSVLAVPLWKRYNPSVISSALIGKPVPQFNLGTLMDEKARFTEADLKGHVSVVNVFASWCLPCRAEQPVIMMMAKETKAEFYAINYKDTREAARDFLNVEGNPYRKAGADQLGRAAIEWGIYGVPETFIVDKDGIIRYRHAGPITRDDAEDVLIPLIERLSK